MTQRAPLLAEDIEACLRPGPPGWRIRIFRETASTNDIVDRAGRGGEPAGFVAFAETQTAGRGRMGRSWDSRPGLGLWFSALVRPPWPASQAGRLTIAAAVAVAEAASAAGVPATIKWPNDVLSRDRKLAGILTELRCSGDQIDYAVVGIGVNVLHGPADFPPDLIVPATSLAMECPRPPRREQLAADILNRLATNIADEFGPVRLRWIRLCSTLGRTIELRNAPEPVRGVAESIDDSGALILRDGAGNLRAIHAGDVIHQEPT
ncbi:MAG: biotin--[acetyl-CoA-carboxylase] ligase [Verrucomicrobiae bacterium]|nr:biotin--[acetyl-CoA-carboxylase] ligase [Verrucomicrobiae bacterium]